MNETSYTRLRHFMEENAFDRFFVYRPENVAWLTGGGDNTVAIGEGVGHLEVTHSKTLLHVSQPEASRLQEEEKCGFKVITYPWHSPPPLQHPNDLEADLTSLRLVLPPAMQERFRWLGRDAAEALGEAMRESKPEWSEHTLAGAIAARMYERGIQPVVLLVAGEQRIFKYRHPLPKDEPLGSLAMGVVCGRRGGLVANVTRMRSWNFSDIDLLYNKVLRVEAKALDASVPGASLGEVVEAVKEAYREIEHPEAFEEHHQGGITGYRSREILGVPGEKTQLAIGMCLAWNPSLPGAKVEDTFLLTEGGLENLTYDPDWPMVAVNGRPRPAILTD